MKQWVVSDIHGCLKTLRKLLEEKIIPSMGDEIYFLGDYIDRGPDSKGVIDYLRSLKEKGYHVDFLKGNHEDFFLEAYEEAIRVKKKWFRISKPKTKKDLWFQHGGKETMSSFKSSDIRKIPLEYIEWIRNLKMYIELDNFFLVHAGFNFDKEDPFEDTVAMLWTRAFEIDPVKVKNKKIIHGHVPQTLDTIKYSLQKKDYYFIDLDNGCYEKKDPSFGNLLALELNGQTLVIQRNID